MNITFYSQNGIERPVRLCESTRRFAAESLGYKYGLDALDHKAVALDEYVTDWDNMPPLKRYDLAVRKIAEFAPVRICEDELVHGAATLGGAILHMVPATYGGEFVCHSVSHLTIDFASVVHCGIDSIRERAEKSLKAHKGTEREAFVDSCINCLDAFDIWHARYIDALRDMPGREENLRVLERVPRKPASTFREAVQSMWFTFAFVRLCGNWPGIGRIDEILGPYLKRDLENGVITLDEARELLAHFFIKGCEWINGEFKGSGDAQHYQNLVISGVNEDGIDVTNEVTYLVLDVIEELGISDFPTTVRVNANTDEGLLRRVAEVMRYGGGVLAVYGEDTVLDALVRDGYDLREARRFANDGCWEVQIPGKTFFRYIPFDGLRILQRETLGCYGEGVDFADFESLYSAYTEALNRQVRGIYEICSHDFRGRDARTGEWLWESKDPCTVVSLFEGSCIERGLSYFEGGAVYNVTSPHIGGLADVVNSLYAIKKLVFDEKRVGFTEFMAILRGNWEGHEDLRLYARNRLVYYGNDSDEVDVLASRLLSDFADMCNAIDGLCGYHFPAGVSTFGRQLEWSPHRLASTSGHLAGDILAANASPTPGSDLEGPTAVIRSYCKPDLTRLVSGTALDIKLTPSNVSGDVGISALTSLIRAFVALGGFFMQPDIVDAAVLRDAQQHPENYRTLSVRVSGWNARFITLNKEWQDMVIAQNLLLPCGMPRGNF